MSPLDSDAALNAAWLRGNAFSFAPLGAGTPWRRSAKGRERERETLLRTHERAGLAAASARAGAFASAVTQCTQCLWLGPARATAPAAVLSPCMWMMQMRCHSGVGKVVQTHRMRDDKQVSEQIGRKSLRRWDSPRASLGGAPRETCKAVETHKERQ